MKIIEQSQSEFTLFTDFSCLTFLTSLSFFTLQVPKLLSLLHPIRLSSNNGITLLISMCLLTWLRLSVLLASAYAGTSFTLPHMPSSPPASLEYSIWVHIQKAQDNEPVTPDVSAMETSRPVLGERIFLSMGWSRSVFTAKWAGCQDERITVFSWDSHGSGKDFQSK